MIDSMFQAGTDQALDDQVQRPARLRPPNVGFWAGFASSAPRGVGSAVAEGIAFGAEIAGAFGQVEGMGPASAGGMFATQTPQERQQADAARLKLARNAGPDFSNEAGDLFRARARDIMPDPAATGTAGQLTAGLANFATKAVGYSLTLGPLGPAALGGDVGLTEADRLKQAGVDKGTRTTAGAVAGTLAAASVMVPMTGATATTRFVKGTTVGVGTVAGQSAAERAILRAAGYDKLAESFDPLDPVALALGVVPGALGARFGHAPAKPAPAGGVKALAEMGLPERQALPFGDVRLDAYAVQAAQREGIPPEILLAVKNAGEKSGSTATSPKGARGVMQFIDGTWKEFGRGDPTDPVNSIDAGARYLKSLHDTYGSWDAAIAHYNGGGRAAAAVRSGKTVNPETAAYLERVRAYLGKTADEHTAAAVRAEPDLVPAARVAQTAEALDASRLVPDGDLAGRDAHVSAVETAADQMGRGERVEVGDLVMPSLRDAEANLRAFMDGSKVVDEAGKPLVMYHGTGNDITAFDPKRPGPHTDMGATFLTADPQVASHYANVGAMFGDKSPNVLPVYVRARNPFDYENAAHRAAVIDRVFETGETYLQGDGQRALILDGKKTVYTKGVLDAGLAEGRNWDLIERKLVQDAIKKQGHDGFYVNEDTKNLAVYQPEQIKSAVGNSGRYDPKSASLTDPILRTAEAVEQLRSARQPKEPPAPRAEKAPAAAPARPEAPPKQPAQATAAGEPAQAPQAAIDRAAAEAALLNPDMLVHLDGMDAPVRVGDLLERVKAEAADDVKMGKLLEVAAACDLTA